MTSAHCRCCCCCCCLAVRIISSHQHRHRQSLSDVMTLNWTYIDNVTSSTLTSSALWSLNYSVPEMAAVTAMLAAMIVVTACGNALVGIALLRFRSLRSVSNMLIGNLAVSDFLLAIVVLPLSTVNECLGRWPLGHVACNVWLTVDVLCCTASIWNLCMIAVDRCTAIVYPLWYRHKRSVSYALPYVTAVWFISLTVSVPPTFLGWSDVYVVDDESQVYQCVLYQSPGYVMFSAGVMCTWWTMSLKSTSACSTSRQATSCSQRLRRSSCRSASLYFSTSASLHCC